MYVSRGDLGNTIDTYVNNEVPLSVTSAGNIRPRSAREFHTIRPEGREDYQLIYVADGCMHFRFAEDAPETIVEKGNMVLFWPNQYQHYELFANEKGEFYWVHFTGYEVEKMLTDLHVSRDRKVFWTGTLSDYRWMLHQMIRELQLKQNHYEEVLCMNLRHLLMLLDRNTAKDETSEAPAYGEIVMAVSYFERHWRENFSMDWYANHCRMSPRWFRKKFQEFTGCSPLQYILSLRMANAMNLLENTDYNITQIAYEVGYENVSYFRRLFQKHTDLTPTEYRNRMKSHRKTEPV